jgi:CheY-like chemotaxis protein
MQRRGIETCGFFLAFAVMGASAALLCAQDPFGGGPGPTPMADPMGKKADDDKTPKGPPPTSDVVILAIRESNPTTPMQLMTAIKQLMDYGAHEEAKRYLAQLIAAKPTTGNLAAIQKKFGTAFFMKMATDKRVQPDGEKVATAVVQSAKQLYTDPARLRNIARQTGDADVNVREEALGELRNAGPDAVAPLLEVTINKNLPQAQAYARDALVGLGETAIEPLIGALEANDPEIRTQAIAVLARLQASRVVPYLLRPAHDPEENPRVQAVAREALKRLTGGVPSKAETEDFLYKKATQYFNGMSPLHPDQDGLVTLWRWDNEKALSVPRYYPANLGMIQLPEVRGLDGVNKTIENVPASSIMAALVARDLYALFPNVSAYKRLFITTHLEAGKLMSGLGEPLPRGKGTVHELVSMVDVASIEEALGWSLKNNHFPAAIAAAEILGDVGDATLLTSTTGAPRPLALALRHPDRRLRFAAVISILKLNSSTAFPGASYVPETLGYFAGSVGTRRALVADPRQEEARSFGGLLATAGYDADIAATGDEAMSLALKQPDYEIIFLGDGIDHDDLNKTWQQLRKDPRTANLLLGFLYREEHRLPLLDKADEDPLARAMPYVHERGTLDFQLTQMFRKAGTKFVPFAERQKQAQVALDQLAHLASGEGPKYYDVLRQEEAVIRALATPGLTVHAAPVLGGLGSNKTQTALVDVASDVNYDLTDRQAAEAAFKAAVARRGILLTTKQIGAQYDRYNASELQDEETQRVLGSILDTLEKNKTAAK